MQDERGVFYFQFIMNKPTKKKNEKLCSFTVGAGMKSRYLELMHLLLPHGILSCKTVGSLLH